MVPKTNTQTLVDAIQEFERKLPDWWYSLGCCSVSRDASCGPDRQGRGSHLLEIRLFDNGFHADLHEGDMADALHQVMEDALEAKEKFVDSSA